MEDTAIVLRFLPVGGIRPSDMMPLLWEMVACVCQSTGWLIPPISSGMLAVAVIMRSDSITFLSQCNARQNNSGCFPHEKANSHSTALPSFFGLSLLLCAVCSCFHTTDCDAYSFTTDGYGIFNVRTHLGACRTHEQGSGTSKSQCTRVDSEGPNKKSVSNPASPGHRTLEGLRVRIPTL